MCARIIDHCPNSADEELFGIIALARAREDQFRSSDAKEPFEKLLKTPLGVGTPGLLEKIDAMELLLDDYLRPTSSARRVRDAIRKRRRNIMQQEEKLCAGDAADGEKKPFRSSRLREKGALNREM